MGNLRWPVVFLNLVERFFNPGKKESRRWQRLASHGAIPRGVCPRHKLVPDPAVRKDFRGLANADYLRRDLTVMGADYRRSDDDYVHSKLAFADSCFSRLPGRWSLRLAPMRLIGLTVLTAGGLGGITVPWWWVPGAVTFRTCAVLYLRRRVGSALLHLLVDDAGSALDNLSAWNMPLLRQSTFS